MRSCAVQQLRRTAPSALLQTTRPLRHLARSPTTIRSTARLFYFKMASETSLPPKVSKSHRTRGYENPTRVYAMHPPHQPTARA
jgi:hypothetical protein